MTRIGTLFAAGMLGASALVPVAAALASGVPTTTGPSITVDRTTVEIGEQISFTVAGFEGQGFTVSVCGNEARRGSTDCDMVGSRALPVDRANGNVTVNQMQVGSPPAPCPCVLRAVSSTNDEVAITPIVVAGHPKAPVVDGGAAREPLVVTVEARPAPQGIGDSARASLGGPARYEITITVRNRSVIAASNVSVAASGGRGTDDFRVILEPEAPGLIPAGQTWQQTVEAVVPYPSLGSFEWRATVSGAGAPVTATTETSSTPTLLIVLAMAFVVIVFALLIRVSLRRHAADSGADPVAAQSVDEGELVSV